MKSSAGPETQPPTGVCTGMRSRCSVSNVFPSVPSLPFPFSSDSYQPIRPPGSPISTFRRPTVQLVHFQIHFTSRHPNSELRAGNRRTPPLASVFRILPRRNCTHTRPRRLPELRCELNDYVTTASDVVRLRPSRWDP